jgi:pyruvate dehydrogenase E2 component (dihydrolipoamide acetyltransferase)
MASQEVQRPMTIKVVMPQMGESILEGTLTKWLKKVGETVARDEPLFEISTDKVDSEIPSPASGVLSEILVPEGETVQINTVLAIIREAGAPEMASGPSEPQRDTDEQQAEAPLAAEAINEGEAAAESGSPSANVSAIQTNIRTSPLVRRLAREHNIDLSEITGSGLEGRITKEDALNYLARTVASEPVQSPHVTEPAKSPEPVAIAPEMPAATIPSPAGIALAAAAAQSSEMPRFMGESEVVPMTMMRKAIAEHMVLSKRTSAHVNTVFDVDMSSIALLRERHKDDFQKREGINLTYMPFLAKALVDSIREFPILNSSVSGESIVYKKPINLGIAVALDNGLIVPVVRDAHLKGFTGLALAIYDLSERARTKRLKPDEVQNGTFTITNPGGFGALFATPIINQPQVAILGVGGIEKRPVVINDAIAIRSMVYLSLSFDHRVIDGAVADRFMARLKERVQGWTQWID